jgi:hypothetical protein
MKNYYQKMGENPFSFLPETYHVTNGLEDEQYLNFLNAYYPRQKRVKKEERHSCTG